MRFAFIAEGNLYLQEGTSPAVEIESPFAQAAADRAAVRNERNAWRNADRGDAGDPFGRNSVWGRQAARAPDGHPVMRHVARGAQPDEVFYTLAMSASSGLFRYNLATREEWRLFHRQDFDSCGLSCDPVNGQIVVASRDKDTLGKLELIDESARRRDRITTGDGHDANPSHDPAARGIVYLQSAGVGRNERGDVVALGPAAICRIDQGSGELTTVLEDEYHDYLQPKPGHDGSLYYIRRPYQSGGDLPLGEKLKAFALLPFHLAGAVFGFLDAFSRMFGKKSLRPARGGPEIAVQHSRYATFHNTTVDLERVLSRNPRPGQELHLVPKTWELVRRDADGAESVLAAHVVSFDVGPKGEVIYSDGLRIRLVGDSTILHEGHVVQSVVFA